MVISKFMNELNQSEKEIIKYKIGQDYYTIWFLCVNT